MSTYKEKLSILSEMIAFARTDAAIKPPEHEFLLKVSRNLGVSRADFDALLTEEVEIIIPGTQAERIVQFHRLILLMNIDQQRHPEEIRKLYDIGVGMGLRPSAIQQVLAIMPRYPDKIVPPDVLIGIFRKHYN